MVSPILDETAIKAALEKPPRPLIETNAQRLRTGAFLMALDAYDRRADRDAVVAALEAALNLATSLGMYNMMAGVKRYHQKNGGVSLADMERTFESLGPQVQQHAQQCAYMAEMLSQCPLDEDKIN